MYIFIIAFFLIIFLCLFYILLKNKGNKIIFRFTLYGITIFVIVIITGILFIVFNN